MRKTLPDFITAGLTANDKEAPRHAATHDADILIIDPTHGHLGIASVAQSVERLSVKLDARGTTNWVAIFSGLSGLVAVMGFIGNMALSPVRDTGLENKERSKSLEERIVPRREHEHIWAEQDRF